LIGLEVEYQKVEIIRA